MLARHKSILKRETLNFFIIIVNSTGLNFTRDIYHIYVDFVVNIWVIFRLTKHQARNVNILKSKYKN